MVEDELKLSACSTTYKSFINMIKFLCECDDFTQALVPG